MLSESVLSVRKELFPQNKTAVSDMPKVNIQKRKYNRQMQIWYKHRCHLKTYIILYGK